MVMNRIAVAAAALTLIAAPAAAQDEWSWSGTVAPGRTIEVKGVNGAIRAVPASGRDVQVQVTKRARRDDPEDVRMVVLEHANGVTICAVYPHQRNREPNECAAGDGGRNSVQNNDVTVEWEVRVPRGVNLVARTVNGGVEAMGLTGNVVARTINGRIEVATSGVAQAFTVNGSIDATLGSSDWTDEIAFRTTNGSVVVGFTGDLNARVDAATVTGDIETDFPLEVRGRFMNRRLSGTVGSGGRVLSLETTNGRIELRRR
ncbi:MAG TPA: DUF4097 family beta strand repeat-containing protein [Longimicrobiales bacterium]|nr:DUF4097 family beta strand repeat-containing protein [Longimicrobiales bacterium]